MEDIRFESKCEINKEYVKKAYSLAKTHSGNLEHRIGFFLRIWVVIVTALALFAAFTFATPALIKLCGFILTADIYFFLRLLLRPALTYRKNTRALGDKPVRIIRFGENVELQIGNSSVAFPYDNIRFIEEKNGYFYVFVWTGNKTILDIPKNSFTVGNPEEFLEFLKEKSTVREPFWSKRQLNIRIFKGILPSFVLLVFFVGLLPLWLLWSDLPLLSQTETVFEDKSRYANDEIQFITAGDVLGGAVAFGVNDSGRIYGVPLERFAEYYVPQKWHNYSLNEIADYNLHEGTATFESDENHMTFKKDGTAVVYGVAYADMWNDKAEESDKAKYTTAPFQYDNKSYVLYYRQTGD